MCGMFGFVNNSPIDLDKRNYRKEFKDLFSLAKSRGKDASGLVICNDKGINIFKAPLSAKSFIQLDSYKKFINQHKQFKINFAFGQTGSATNGFQTKNENNQPIKSTNFVMIHNGIIVNNQDLWNEINPKIKCPESDTKILLAYLQKIFNKTSNLALSVQILFQKIKGSASVIIANNFNQKICIATNTGSLYWVNLEKSKTYYFASESWMLKEFIKKNYPKLSKYKISQVKPLTAIIFTENKKSKTIIDLSKKVNKQQIKIKEKKQRLKTIIDLSPKNTPTDPRINKLYNFKNELKKIKKHHFPTEQINKIKRCNHCILPATTPFISFDQNGVCNYCHDHQKITYKGVEELKKLVAPFRKNNGEADCLIAFSGGRDSSYALHYLKKELGMNPIAYTYDWGMITDIGRRNQARLVSKLGVEHIVISADIIKKRQHIKQNIQAWLNKPVLGMVPLFMEGDKQSEFYANQLMEIYKLDLMIFCRGNEFEKDEFKAGHCGIKDADPDGVIHHLSLKNKFKIFYYYLNQYISNPAYINSSFFDTIFAFYSTYVQKHQFVYFWHYIPWQEDLIVNTLIKEYGWENTNETNTTWRNGDGSVAFYNYIYYAVQGFTENDSFRSRQIREGLITRSKALKMVNQENSPRYKALKWYFDQVGLDGDKVLTEIDQIDKLY